MFCSRCGSLMDSKTSFCTNCGLKLQSAIPSTEDCISSDNQLREDESIKKTQNSFICFFIPWGIVLYLIGTILSSCLHGAFHIVAIVGGLFVLIAVKELIARSKYPPIKK